MFPESSPAPAPFPQTPQPFTPLPPAAADIPLAPQPASFGARFGNWAIDRILSIWLSTVMSIIAYLILRVAILHGNNMNDLAEYGWFIVSYLLFQFLYYFLPEKQFGRTFGKSVTRTQVIAKNGYPASGGQIALRTIARVIPFDELSVFFNQRKTWHDEASNTLVVSTHDLPEHMQKRGHAMQIATALLFVPVIGLFLFWPAYERLTGGERIELSQNTPTDLRLVKYNEVTEGDSHYFALEYLGENRTVDMHRMIAGFDFDPDESCVYMTPTKEPSYGYTPISKSLHCSVIGQDAQKHIKAYKVTLDAAVNDSDLTTKAPDYYINKPPYRYAIKATQGQLTDEEVRGMVNNYTTYTAAQLKDTIAANTH